MPSDIIVCGLAPRTMNPFSKIAKDYWTIGVNDCDRYFHPDHLVILDPPYRFRGDRPDYICNTKAKTVWITPITKWKCLEAHPDRRALNTQRIDRPSYTSLNQGIPHATTSPLVCCGLAHRLGAKRIGLIGVDLLPDHHMHKKKDQVNRNFEKLAKLLREEGTILVNLCEGSELKTIPFAPLSFIRTKEQCNV